jgi:hypothetical protein
VHQKANSLLLTHQSGSAGSGDALPRQPNLGAGSGTIERECGIGDERRKRCFLWLYASRLPVDRPDVFPHHPPNMGLDLGRPRHSGNHSGKAWGSGCRSAESQFCSLLRSKSRITIGSRTVARSLRPIFHSKSARKIGPTPDPLSTVGPAVFGCTLSEARQLAGHPATLLVRPGILQCKFGVHNSPCPNSQCPESP